MKKQASLKKTLRILVIMLLVFAVAFAGYYYWLEGVYAKQNRAAVERDLLELPAEGVSGDKIHFLNTGSSDAILLESDGHFALVDSGEDTDNPTGKENLALEGYEQYVLGYLKEHASNADGKVVLDFVLGTHCHSDHIGGFDTILLDPAVSVGTVYLKAYSTENKNSTELSWDNLEVYNQMLEAVNTRGFKLVQDIGSRSVTLGNMLVSFYNTEDRKAISGGENDNSVGTLVEVNGKRVFLAADINNWSGDEKRISKEIGEVDIVKAGHHSHFGSGSVYFGKGLSPQYLVVTSKKAHLINLSNYAIFARSEYFVTGETGGIIAQLNADGISFYAIGDFDTQEEPA
ncbi:MAG: MBL fold metallo-hydrolase [Clostridium sp.]|jgi:beta-lactamase superfamily II metal-dependent hydrolase|nr:MBL fold metallo-hydrolase [Clostridium sp.]